jgi:hypothetical protein
MEIMKIGIKKIKIGEYIRLKPSQRNVDKGTERLTDTKKIGEGA